MRSTQSGADRREQYENAFEANAGSWDLHSDGNTNAADEVISELGLVLVVTLGVVLAINTILVALHIG